MVSFVILFFGVWHLYAFKSHKVFWWHTAHTAHLNFTERTQTHTWWEKTTHTQNKKKVAWFWLGLAWLALHLQVLHLSVTRICQYAFELVYAFFALHHHRQSIYFCYAETEWEIISKSSSMAASTKPGHTAMLKCSKAKFKPYFSTLYAYNKYSSVHFVCLTCSQSLRQFSQFSLITLKHRTCYNPGLIVRARLSALSHRERATTTATATAAKRAQLSFARSCSFWIFTSFVFDGSKQHINIG